MQSSKTLGGRIERLDAPNSRQSRPLAEGKVRYGDDFAVMAGAHRGPVSVGGDAAAYYTRDGSLIYASRARIMHERR
jgi:hypothetical protein